MIFERDLNSKGFEIRDNILYYDYSEFELLMAKVSEHDCADGTKALKVSDLTLLDPLHDYTHHFCVSYDLYFRDINKFYELLTLLNYPIRVKMDMNKC